MERNLKEKQRAYAANKFKSERNNHHSRAANSTAGYKMPHFDPLIDPKSFK